MSDVLQRSLASLRSLVSTFDPAGLDGVQAMQLVEQFAEVERLAAAGRTLAAGRVAETEAWTVDGAFRDVGNWMASITGTTVGRAKSTLETAERLGALPETAAVLRSGALSDAQVDAVAKAAAADPNAERALLSAAETEGVKGLKDRCARVEAAVSTDQAERYELARNHRYLRHRTLSDVEGLLELRGPLELTAGVMAALQPYEAELFEEARTAERREPPDALAFDAMTRMADRSAAADFVACPTRAPATVVARVDHSAFTRGHSVAGEVCEIVGVGPIPVAVARRLADDAFLKALIHDGTDVLAVSHLGRSIPARLRTAVEELSPECALQGCHASRHLEIDHNTPVAEGGLTEIGNLAGVCHFHHAYKHTHNLRLAGTGTSRHFVTPERSRGDP